MLTDAAATGVRTTHPADGARAARGVDCAAAEKEAIERAKPAHGVARPHSKYIGGVDVGTAGPTPPAQSCSTRASRHRGAGATIRVTIDIARGPARAAYARDRPAKRRLNVARLAHVARRRAAEATVDVVAGSVWRGPCVGDGTGVGLRVGVRFAYGRILWACRRILSLQSALP
jgi:hypothetical protein